MRISRASKQEKQIRAILRSEWNLKKRLETIEWEYDVLIPQIESMKANKGIPALGIKPGTTFDIRVESNDHPNRVLGDGGTQCTDTASPDVPHHDTTDAGAGLRSGKQTVELPGVRLHNL